MTTTLPSFELEAFNTATESENKIHDDVVAASFGFSGGLVPGVEVYAYLCHPAIELWGDRFLSSSEVSVRFGAPIYDGEPVEIKATLDDGTLHAEAHSRNGMQASLEARLREEEISPPATTAAPLPALRPIASPAAFETGEALGSFTRRCRAEDLIQYLAEVQDPRSSVIGLNGVHPGWLLRLANDVLMENVILGPWIHVGSTVNHLRSLPIGQAVRVESHANRHYEHKGHLFVVLDVVIFAEDGPEVAWIEHTAIYEPRQVRARTS